MNLFLFLQHTFFSFEFSTWTSTVMQPLHNPFFLFSLVSYFWDIKRKLFKSCHLLMSTREMVIPWYILTPTVTRPPFVPYGWSLGRNWRCGSLNGCTCIPSQSGSAMGPQSTLHLSIHLRHRQFNIKRDIFHFFSISECLSTYKEC